MTKIFAHESVMPQEVINYFDDFKGKTIVDATAGGGGHLSMLAQVVGERGRIIAFDRDPRAHEDDAAGGVQKHFPNIITLFQRPFSAIKSTLRELKISSIDGLICDLGVSSHQLDEPKRGFSFQNDGPIDMRMDTNSGMSAYEWLAHSSERDIADTIFKLGDERKSRQIAARIKKEWPIENSTGALAQLVLSAIKQKKWSKIHPATRTFQALRMAVNEEVKELETLLHDLPEILSPEATVVFLSFHSIEDRLIKLRFKELALNKEFVILTKKPAVASEQEIDSNRRSRSAKLRALKRVSL
ncbi:MAG: 16S rRNA (cytosine(1402)-N(4))-methyltransferase RsmH [Myxococcales bacterium]|nr:16S rRNA (cytosine(1402)-N(4))-methyltransferase RsmH [Myxococcales bacterium]USN51295.1 MAG: 16S rRNA (cytosine(1402)-N(4))-methyltransferase RsmH [Myxococcales bacterium]